MSNEGVPSRLAGRTSGPMRGLGAGYAENQRLAGAQDPDTAARLAASDPEAYSVLLERQTQAAALVEEKRAALIKAVVQGEWTPPAALPPNASWDKLLAHQSPQLIEDWYDKYIAEMGNKEEAEDEKQLREDLRRELEIQPDDPMYDPLVDRSRRQRIESKLEPLDFETMLFKGYVEQTVPLHDNLSITLRTIATHHTLWIEHYIGTLSDSTSQNLRHTYSLLQVAASLEKLNGKHVTPSLEGFVRQEQRDEFYSALSKRMEQLTRLPTLLTDDFIIQFAWFTGRVRKLLSGNLTEKVGNF